MKRCYSEKCKENQRAFCRECHKRIRLAVLTLLGGKCVWPDCTWTDSRALQIDHIHGGGTKESKSLGCPRRLHEKILKMDHPETEYQLLCANHNWIKRHENKETSFKGDSK